MINVLWSGRWKVCGHEQPPQKVYMAAYDATVSGSPQRNVKQCLCAPYAGGGELLNHHAAAGQKRAPLSCCVRHYVWKGKNLGRITKKWEIFRSDCDRARSKSGGATPCCALAEKCSRGTQPEVIITIETWKAEALVRAKAHELT